MATIMRLQLSLSGRCLQCLVQGKKPAARRVFYWVNRIGMRTIVYIDGYNLYYSILRQSRYKWLDMVKLFSAHILHAQDPKETLHNSSFCVLTVSQG